jgi:glycosyltransferase involved in cell wall biosynthesis
MNAIDCLVHPQVGTEAFGLVLLEAFACGKPVIASALDGIPEAFAVGDVGQLVEPESVAALAAAMARQVAHGRMAPPRVAELHARVAAGFSFRRLAEGVQRIYESILRRGAAAAASAGQGMGPGRSLG